ncbi:hypothetical protein DFQ27_003462 [Actinomortierella ambigua]|uniref:SP-RING-type domain-containing protein n=1 Tax=Actinomortierella ambigua TaxID=1343610 RepID=A0A9P6U4S8_9FUNG|nr:hypothetical protein DFQ27_003462 [Actinomortierella ambigua]
MTVATQPTASTSRSSQARPERRVRDVDSGDDGMEQGGPSSEQRNASRALHSVRAPPNMFPRSFLSSLNPAIGAFTPHVDLLKKGAVLTTDTAVDYEESHAKGGYQDEAVRSKSNKAKGGAKAAMERSYTTSSTIHEMEDIAADYVALQDRHMAERRALEGLQQKISQGLGGQIDNLVTEYQALLNRELQLVESRKKEAKKRKEPTGVEQVVKDFRQKVWEVHHPHTPLPSSTKNQGGADDDDGLEMIGAEESFKCPLTTLYLEDPYTSVICKHSYSKEALIAHLRSSRICPVQGCSRPLSMQDVQPNRALARRVARHVAVEQESEQIRDEFSYTTVE